MKPSEWPHFAVPSYRRAQICHDRTLRLLSDLGVPRERVSVFVADQEEAELYDRRLDPKTYDSIVVAVPGMGAVRRYIQSYYAEGTELVSIDDDISGFYRKLHDKRYEELDGAEFETMVRLGFWSAKKVGARLWGIYPVLNPMFMKQRVNVGLSYIVGAFWGCVNSHDPGLAVSLDDKEDFERTLKFYIADGAVVRLESYSLKTAYYTTPGGMQETRTPERVDESARILVRRYPMLCRLNTRKKSGRTEVRLKDSKRKVLT